MRNSAGSSCAFIVSFLVVALLAAKGETVEGGETRACVATDLTGVYWLADFWEEHPGPFGTQAGQFPYHFLVFFSGATWSSMSFNNPPATLGQLMRGLPRPFKYTLEPDGRIVLYRGGNPEFVGGCALSLRTGKGLQKSDLILTGNEAGIESELHELFRPWTGEQTIGGAVSGFDPAPSPVQVAPASPAATGLPDVQPSLPDAPAPVAVRVFYASVGGPTAGTPVRLVVTNQSHAPLSAFVIVYMHSNTAGRLQNLWMDACLGRSPAWQPGQQWIYEFGHFGVVGNAKARVGAALFSDGSTWGDPHRLAKLKQRRGNCQWPGS